MTILLLFGQSVGSREAVPETTHQRAIRVINAIKRSIWAARECVVSADMQLIHRRNRRPPWAFATDGQ